MHTVTPGEVGFDSSLPQRIEEHFEKRYLKPGRIAGGQVLVARKGEVCLWHNFGLKDRERQLPVENDTIFRIYSMTKPLTSIALMQLCEQGRVALTDPVHRFIPEFEMLQVYKSGVYPAIETVPTQRPMTVHDLLCHMAGLTYTIMYENNVDNAYRQLHVADWDYEENTETLVQKLAQLPLMFSPGERWNYSVATDVVGRLVEVISGVSLEDYFQANILDPLGMVDTHFNIPKEKIERFSACYFRDEKRQVVLQDDPHNSQYHDRTFFSGGGGLVSTTQDYYRFCSMLLNKGELDGQRIIGARTLELMTVNHLPDGKDLSSVTTGGFSEVRFDGIGFGLGFSVINDQVRNNTLASKGTYGWGGMASTLFWIDPAEEIIAIFMCQLIPSYTYNFRGQLENLVYGCLSD